MRNGIDAFIESDPLVKTWADRHAKDKATRRLYANQLDIYFREHLSKKHTTPIDWLETVKQDQESKDFKIRTRWARELEDYVLTRLIKGKPMSKPGKGLMISGAIAELILPASPGAVF